MPLLKKISFDDKGRMIGFPEKRKSVLLGVPTPHAKSFYSRAIKTKRILENWNQDVENAREDLIKCARQDKERYYQIPKEPTETKMYDIIFSYNTFKERQEKKSQR